MSPTRSSPRASENQITASQPCDPVQNDPCRYSMHLPRIIVDDRIKILVQFDGIRAGLNGAQCNRMAGIIRLHRQAQAHRAHDGSARSEGAPDEQRLRVELPKGLGGLAANVFHLAPDHNNWAPSESYSEVKKGFQGSGFDLGLNFGVGAA